MRVHMRHVRAAGLCSQGGREWCRRHNLSWSDFLANGLDAEVVRATGDALAMRALTEAEKEAAGEQR